MYSQDFGSICEGSSGNESCSIFKNNDKKVKPIEIYVYIDPVCRKSWSLEAITKKLVAQYGKYFTLRYCVGTSIGTLDSAAGKKISNSTADKVANVARLLKDYEVISDNPPSPYKAAIAIKTAELQGKASGMQFLRRLKEQLFLDAENILSNHVLLGCAALAKLDIEEFKKDFVSKSPTKALLLDLKTMAEMDVSEFPTLVLFNIRNDKEGIKIAGSYPYMVYVQVLTDALGEKPEPSEPPEIKDFMKKYYFVETKEISLVYDMTEQETLREMKKLKLKQIVEPVSVSTGLFWRYIEA